ncbi:MAG: hypothetical protein J5771_05510 [Bacteroidales bacterium]|nr:hypothetical protein [Bacteroidales bacterium]
MKKVLILVTIALLGIMAGGCCKHHAHKKRGTKARTPIEINLSGVTRDTLARNGDVLTDTLKSNVKISIAHGASVTLKDLYIVGVNWSITPWAAITCEGDATLILQGNSYIEPFHLDYPGIFIPENKTLKIKGDGFLEVYGRCSAGIGAGLEASCGNIVIEGGSINAYGYKDMFGGGAGIGGASKANCGSITIKGGTINAFGSYTSAGIGGGRFGNCGPITITSGVKSVVAQKGDNAPNSIGAGLDGTCDGVTIEDPSKVTQQ